MAKKKVTEMTVEAVDAYSARLRKHRADLVGRLHKCLPILDGIDGDESEMSADQEDAMYKVRRTTEFMIQTNVLLNHLGTVRSIAQHKQSAEKIVLDHWATGLDETEDEEA